MKTLLSSILVASLVLVSFPRAKAAIWEGIGVGLEGGSLGVGVQVSKYVSDRFNAKLAFHTLSMSYNSTLESTDPMDVTADLSLGSWSVLTDFHPRGSSFYLSGGIIGNNNEVKSTISPQNPKAVGERTYSVAEQGSLTSTLSWPSIAPYLGIGWGDATSEGFGMTFDIGVMYQGSPSVDMTGTGLIAPSGPRNQAVMEDAFKGAITWFVINLGFTYGII